MAARTVAELQRRRINLAPLQHKNHGRSDMQRSGKRIAARYNSFELV
jgi:hypothetical protein